MLFTVSMKVSSYKSIDSPLIKWITANFFKITHPFTSFLLNYIRKGYKGGEIQELEHALQLTLLIILLVDGIKSADEFKRGIKKISVFFSF